MAKIHGHAVYDGLEFYSNATLQANMQQCLTIWSGTKPTQEQIKAIVAYDAAIPTITLPSLKDALQSLGCTLLVSVDLPRATYPAAYTVDQDAGMLMQTFSTSALAPQTVAATGTATFFLMLNVYSTVTANIINNTAATVISAILGNITSDETTDLILTDRNLTAGSPLVLGDLQFKFPIDWQADDYQFTPNEDLTSVEMIVEVIGRSDSTYVSLNELMFCDRLGQPVPYTTTPADVWDNGTGTPFWWNNATQYNRTGLNDLAYTSAAADACALNRSNDNATVTRFRVTFASLADVAKIDYITAHVGVAGVNVSQPNEINVYSLVGNIAFDKPSMLNALSNAALRKVAAWTKATMQHPTWVIVPFVPAVAV